MARVKGIIAAGLAGASRSSGSTSDATARGQELADNVRDRTQKQERVDSAGLPPDWLASSVAGAGAGWVFGPVGALIGAGVTAILSKRRRDGLAAFASQEAESMERSFSRADDSFQQAFDVAETDQQRAELSIAYDEFNSYRELSNNPDPLIRGKAALKALEVAGSLDGELDEFQADREKQAELDRSKFSEEVGYSNGIRDDLVKESDAFLTRQDAYNRMLAVEDTSWGDQVLMVNAFKMIDPNSAVLPGEAATAANAAGVPDFMLTAYNRLVRDGKRLQPDQRVDILRQSGLQYAESRADQVDRNTDAIARGRAQGVRDDLLKQLSVPVKTREELPYPIRGDEDSSAGAAVRGFEVKQNDDGLWGVYGPDGYVIDDMPLQQDRFTLEDIAAKTKEATGGDEPSWYEQIRSPEAVEQRRLEREKHLKESPGLFQPGGFFNRNAERPTND